MIKLIVCIDLKGNIGKNNDLLYHMKEDMEFFKEKTKRQEILMGLNTWYSLPNKPLKDRLNIVVGFDREELNEIKEELNEIKTEYYPLLTYTDLRCAIDEYIDDVEYINNPNDLYIIGGASIYNQVIDMDIIDEAYVTIVNDIVEDADVSINIDLLRSQLYREEILKSFKYKDKDVKIVRYYK